MSKILSSRRSVLIILGLLCIIVGYVFLARDSISLAPILLVLGYCVLVPLAFI